MSQPLRVQTRLQAIEERLARLRAERDRLLARASKTSRRQETRRKIVIGGTVLAALEHEGVPAMQTRAELLKWLESRLTRPHDRSVFELAAREQGVTARGSVWRHGPVELLDFVVDRVMKMTPAERRQVDNVMGWDRPSRR